VPLSEVAKLVVLLSLLLIIWGEVLMALDAEATPMAQVRLSQPIVLSERVRKHSCEDTCLIHGRCHAFALVVGRDEAFVMAGHVANVAKGSICRHNMPNGP
jgi:hypothetical protein